MRSNQCEMLSPDPSARFLIHDNDGNILSEHKTDSDGHLEIEWSDANQHISQLTDSELNNPDSDMIISIHQLAT